MAVFYMGMFINLRANFLGSSFQICTPQGAYSSKTNSPTFILSFERMFSFMSNC